MNATQRARLNTARRLYTAMRADAADRALTAGERQRLLNVAATIRRLTGRHAISL